MTWMIPFVASMSTTVTDAPSTMTEPPSTVICTEAPLSVSALGSVTTTSDVTAPATTW